MTTYFNRERNEFEIYHNGIKIDTAKIYRYATMLMEFYEKLIGPKGQKLISIPQDKGKYHIHYIRILSNEIYMEKNSDLDSGEVNWNNCLKIALLLHKSKLKDRSTFTHECNA